MSERISEAELEEWTDLYQRQEYAHEVRIYRLIAEVRALIEEQAKEIERFEADKELLHVAADQLERELAGVSRA